MPTCHVPRRFPALLSPHARVRWGFVGFTVTMLAVPLVGYGAGVEGTGEGQRVLDRGM